MIIDLQKLDEIKYQFTQLGMVVSELSSTNEDYFKSIMSHSEKLNDMLTSLIPETQLSEASNHVDTILAQVDKVDTIIGDMTGSFGGISTLGSSLDSLQNKFTTLSNDIQAVKKDAPEKKTKEKKKKKGKPGLISKEMSSVLGKFKQFLSVLKVPAIGALLAGGIGILAYGEKERQRLKAEQGEVSDILITAVDGHLAALKKTSTEWLSDFQERMQKFYGISKNEIQAAAKVFSDAGIKVEEWMKGRDESLGVMGDNLYSFSIGVDKLLNVAGGTTAASMVDYAERYGMSLAESKQTIMKMLEVGGGDDGLGFNKFNKMVNTTAPALEQLGFSVSSTADFLGGMQEHFEGLKIPKQMAGNLLVKGAQSLAAGISNMSIGWKRAISEKMGYGTGIRAVQKFDDYWERMSENKDDPEAASKFINEIVGIILEFSGGDEDRAKFMMKEALNFDSRAAFLAIESQKASKEEAEDPTNKGKAKKGKQARKRAVTAVAESAKTEAQKRTEWERHMNLWMKGISKIGMGMLGMTSTWLSRLILYFRLIPQYLDNIFEGIFGDKRNAKVENEKLDQFVNETLQYDKANNALVKDGWNDLKTAGMGMLDSTFRKTMDNVEKAWNTDLPNPFDSATESRESARKSYEGTTGGITAPSTVRTVTVPVAGGGITDAYSSDYLNAKEAAEKQVMGPAKSEWNDYWKGKKPLRIVNFGADEQGNVKLALVGECPRCALSYDEGFDEDVYEKSWSAESAEGTEILGVNTNKSMNIDLSHPEAMGAVSDVAMKGSTRKKRSKAGKSATNFDPELVGVLRDVAKEYPGAPIKVFKGAGAEEGPHGKGEAVDIGVQGVKSKDLARFLHEKGYGSKKGGLGIYPNRPFVHVDVRKGTPKTWVDESGNKESAKNVARPKQWINENLYKTETDDSEFQAPKSVEGV